MASMIYVIKKNCCSGELNEGESRYVEMAKEDYTRQDQEGRGGKERERCIEGRERRKKKGMRWGREQ